MSLMGELIDELVLRRRDGYETTEIRLSPRSWDRIISEVGEQDGIIASDGLARSFLGTPVVLDDRVPNLDIQ